MTRFVALVASFLGLIQPAWAPLGNRLDGARIAGGRIGGVTTTSGALACTVGPFVASGAGSLTLAQVSSQIDSAPNGAVVCLTRGQTWSAFNGINLTTSHPNGNRVTVCASTGTNCSDSGAADTIVTTTANAKSGHANGNDYGSAGVCVRGNTGSGGYTFKHIHCLGPVGGNDGAGSFTAGLAINKGTAHWTFEDGTLDTFGVGVYLDDGTGAPADDVSFGTLGHVQEWTGSVTNTTHQMSYGSCTNCNFTINYHGVTLVGDTHYHVLDFSCNACSSATGGAESQNLTIQGSTFAPSGGGAVIKLASCQNVVVRDNTFSNGNGEDMVGFETHNDGNSYGCIGGEVYRNKFDMRNTTGGAAVGLSIGQNVKIYNNIAMFPKGDFQRGFFQIRNDVQHGNSDLQAQNVDIFNNTVVRTGSSTNGYGVIGDTPPQQGNRSNPTGMRVANNVVIDQSTTGFALLFLFNHGGCGAFGTNGADIHDNFAYAPNDASPQISPDSGCSAADHWVKGGATSGDDGTAGFVGDTGTSPGLTDYANFDFTVVNSGSAVYKRGGGAPGSALCPATDYAGNAQTNPCTIGAYSNVP